MRVLSSVFELATGARRGLSVLPAEDPAHAAGLAVDTLGGPPALSLPEALAELARRRDARVAAALARLRHAQAEAAVARATAGTAARRVPPAARGVAPAAVRAAAATLLAARRAVRATASLGPRPELDREAARRAHAAHASVLEARAAWRRRLGRTSRVLAAANVAGVVLVAARLRTAAVDPLFPLVAVLPLVALVHAGVTMAHGVRRARTATIARRAALDAAGVPTMSALAARTTRADAWEARAARLAAAGAAMEDAERSWRALVGLRVDPAQGEQVAGALVAAHAAHATLVDREAQCAAAAVGLQAAEDGAGAAGEPPLVVLAERASDGDLAALLAHLAPPAGSSPVVVVVGVVGAPVPSVPAVLPGAVVDLGERVVAGVLHRLGRRGDHQTGASRPGAAAAGR